MQVEYMSFHHTKCGLAQGVGLLFFICATALGAPNDTPLTPERILKEWADPGTRRIAKSELHTVGSSLMEPIASIYKNNPQLQPAAAEALFFLASSKPKPPEAIAAVPVFIALLKSSDSSMQTQAAQALGEMGASSRSAIGVLAGSLTNSPFGQVAARALISIAESLQDDARQIPLNELKSAAQDLEQAEAMMQSAFSGDQAVVEYTARIRRPREYLLLVLQLEDDSAAHTLLRKALGHMELLLTGACVLGIYALVGFVFWFHPPALVTDSCSATPLRRVTGIHWLSGHQRTQEAWIARHLNKCTENLTKRAEQEDQAIRVAVPIKVDGKAPDRIDAGALRKIFQANRVRLLIHGEGGVGKTNLVFQIVRWAVERNINSRLCERHVMVPVLLPAGFSLPKTADAKSDANHKEVFLRAIAEELANLADLPRAPSADWVEQLLVSGRILLILDDLMEANPAMQSVLGINGGGCSANALVVGSRNELALRDTFSAKLEPVRLEGDNLDDFIRGYLDNRNKLHLFEEDENSLHETCHQLRAIASKHSITVLMAKLYADLMVARHSNVDVSSIPDLMLQYLSHLNRASNQPGVDLPQDSEIHPAAKRLAWECLKDDFVLSSLDRVAAIKVLGDDALAKRKLSHMEKLLRLLRVDSTKRDRIRFSLDPLAEYLAGLYLAETFRENASSWEGFLKKAEIVRTQNPGVASFLAVVRDCCEAERGRSRIPGFVFERLSLLLGK